MKRMVPRGWHLPAAVLVVLGLAGAAYAAIPDSAGVIHGCYKLSGGEQGGQLRVVAEEESCRRNEAPIQWNQRGAAGAPGPAGPAGPAGADGEDGEDGQDGQDGQDGADFDGTFTSPNGAYTLSVTDAGVQVTGAGSTISLTGTGIVVQSLGGSVQVRGTSIDVRADLDAGIRAGTALSLRGGASTLVEGTGSLALRGGSVTVNDGAACRPAARVGDLVAPGAGGGFPAAIATGSPTVCIG